MPVCWGAGNGDNGSRVVCAGHVAGHPSDLNIIWPMILCGAGFGLFQSPNNHTIITSAPRERSGGASGMLGTARLLGQSTGAALVALMLNQFGDSGTHLSLLAAAIPATRGGGERFTYYATTRSGVKARHSTRFSYLPVGLLFQVLAATQRFNAFIQRWVRHKQLA